MTTKRILLFVIILMGGFSSAYAEPVKNSLSTEHVHEKKITEPLSNPFPFDESKQEADNSDKFTYNIDPEHTSVEFRVKHMGIAWVTGRFRDFYGTFVFNPQNPTSSKTNVAIRTNSIDTGSAKRDKHLRSADFLDYMNFKKIFFISNSVKQTEGNNYQVTGVLTIRNIQREVTLDMQHLGTLLDPWGNQRAAFEAKTVINRKDFNLTWNRVLEAGSLLVGEEIEVKLYVEGVLQKDNAPKLSDPNAFKLNKD